MGRGRVQLKRIENKISRQVTFSKRRSGLQKKAREISILCDADVGLIIFSTKGKLFELSTDSSMEGIIERYEQYVYSEKRVGNDSERKENWCLEYSKLTARIEFLQTNIRNYGGQDLDPLSLKELQNLEHQIESALKRIRTGMNQLMNESISQLQKKERSLQEQNNLLAKQLIKENEKQQIEESNKQEKEGSARNISTSGLLKSPSELHRIPSLTMSGSEHQTGDDEDGNQIRTDSNIPPWLLKHVNQ